MRSPRSRFETACRVGAFAAIGWLLGSSLIPSTGRASEHSTTRDLEMRLPAWTRASRATALHGVFVTAPTGWAIDWLAALKHRGHAVTWGGTPPALAVRVEPLSDPRGGARIGVSAPAGARVALRDEASVIDSLRVVNLGGSVTAPIVV